MKRASLGSTATSIAILGVNALSGIALARSLGPIGRGEVASLVVWVAFATAIASLGSVGTLTYFVALPASSDAYALRQLKRAYPIMAVIGVGLFLAFSKGGSDGEGGAVIAMAVLVPTRLLFFLVQAYLQGRERFGLFNWNRLLAAAGSSCVIVALALAGLLTVLSAAISYLAVGILALVLAVAAALVERARVASSTDTGSDGKPGSFWNYSARNFVASASMQGNAQIDVFALTLVAPTSAVGIYAVAAGFAAPIAVVGSSIALVVVPRVAGAATRDERLGVVRRSTLYVAFGGAIAMAISIVLAGALIPLLFGPSFEAAVSVSRVLAVGMWAFGMSMVAGAALKGLGRPGVAAISQLAGLLVTLGGILGLSNGGLMKAACAATAGFLVSLLIEAASLMFGFRRESSLPDVPMEFGAAGDG